jgi:hypothetical protein
MARPEIPPALVMRELKYGDRPAGERDRVAGILRQQDRREEAILLFEGRADHPFVDEEVRWAVEHGAGFHLLAIGRLGRALERGDLEACARRAEADGRYLEARLVCRALGDDAGLARLSPHLPPSLRPPAPTETHTA